MRFVRMSLQQFLSRRFGGRPILTFPEIGLGGGRICPSMFRARRVLAPRPRPQLLRLRPLRRTQGTWPYLLGSSLRCNQ